MSTKFSESELKSILSAADDFSLSRSGRLFTQVLDAIEYIGQNKLKAFTEPLYKLLESKSHVIRTAVVYSLGSYSKIHSPQFKFKAYEMWQHDEDKVVRQAALVTWIEYYHNTNNVKILSELYAILINTDYCKQIRHTALCGIYLVCNDIKGLYTTMTDISKIMHGMTEKEFKSAIDWQTIDRLANFEGSVFKLKNRSEQQG